MRALWLGWGKGLAQEVKQLEHLPHLPGFKDGLAAQQPANAHVGCWINESGACHLPTRPTQDIGASPWSTLVGIWGKRE